MAHFAKLKEQIDPTGFTNNTHLVVQTVIAVNNKHVPSDKHIDGETWCKNFYNNHDTMWKQTSYHHNFRKQYAGMGSVYDPVKDIFIRAQPFASWSIDANDDWQAPVTYPTIQHYGDPQVKPYVISWDEDNLRWTAQDVEDPPHSFNWDPSNLAWVAA